MLQKSGKNRVHIGIFGNMLKSGVFGGYFRVKIAVFFATFFH